MKTIRKLLYRDIVASVLFVSLAFLSLYFFVGLVDALESVGGGANSITYALHAALLQLPLDFYELFPIAVLIGTIYSLARLAQGSEFTILRTGGLGPGRALFFLAQLGLAFALVTYTVGDFVAPWAERQVVLLKAQRNGSVAAEGAGAWLKEKRIDAETKEERSVSINIAAANARGGFDGIRIYQFDADGRLLSRTQARSASAAPEGADDQGVVTWTLLDAQVARWPAAVTPGQPEVQLSQHAELPLRSTLTASVVAAAVLPLNTMTTWELWRYSTHLNTQAQASQTYQIRFWRKALYPLACLVMVALALPFAYLNARADGISFKVFGGVMLGISFVLLSNLAGHMGMLRDWTPWVAAATPSVFYLLLSMAAFAWLVRYR